MEERQARVVTPGCPCDQNSFGDPLQLPGFEASWPVVQRSVPFKEDIDQNAVRREERSTQREGLYCHTEGELSPLAANRRMISWSGNYNKGEVS